jgi:hypothetical protein
MAAHLIHRVGLRDAHLEFISGRINRFEKRLSSRRLAGKMQAISARHTAILIQ